MNADGPHLKRNKERGAVSLGSSLDILPLYISFYKHKLLWKVGSTSFSQLTVQTCTVFFSPSLFIYSQCITKNHQFYRELDTIFDDDVNIFPINYYPTLHGIQDL